MSGTIVTVSLWGFLGGEVHFMQGGTEMLWSECHSLILLSMRSRAHVSSPGLGTCDCLQVAEVTLCDLEWVTKGHTSYSWSS